MYISKIQLAAAMADKNLNFRKLAIACGVSRATISYINNGKTCTPNLLVRIAKALDVEPESLIEKEATQ